MHMRKATRSLSDHGPSCDGISCPDLKADKHKKSSMHLGSEARASFSSIDQSSTTSKADGEPESRNRHSLQRGPVLELMCLQKRRKRHAYLLEVFEHRQGRQLVRINQSPGPKKFFPDERPSTHKPNLSLFQISYRQYIRLSETLLVLHCSSRPPNVGLRIRTFVTRNRPKAEDITDFQHNVCLAEKCV